MMFMLAWRLRRQLLTYLMGGNMVNDRPNLQPTVRHSVSLSIKVKSVRKLLKLAVYLHILSSLLTEKSSSGCDVSKRRR